MGFGDHPVAYTGLALALIIGGCTAGCSCANNWEVSNGQRTGMINKVSKRGYFWESWEGQMALEGITSSGTSVGANVWAFSMDRFRKYGKDPDALAERLRGYMDSGTKVKVTYVEVAKGLPWRNDTDYFLVDAVPVAIPGRGNESKLEKESSDESEIADSKLKGVLNNLKHDYGNEVTLDGRTYLLRHDKDGHLKVQELKDIDTK